MPHPFASFKGKRVCSQDCFNKAIIEDKKMNPVMETKYKDTIDVYPPNWAEP